MNNFLEKDPEPQLLASVTRSPSVYYLMSLYKIFRGIDNR